MVTRRMALAGVAGLAVTGLAHAQNAPSAISSTDAERALREALTTATRTAVAKLGKQDGYWGDPKVRIPLPDSLARLRETMAQLRLTGPLDDLHLRMNRAAEAAAPKARQLFVNAVQRMSVEDALGVLRGGDDAATAYLRRATESDLTAAFKPVVASALEKSGAFASLDRMTARYGAAFNMGASPRERLTTFAVGKALDGLFTYVAAEERAIRANPAKAATSLLRRVFGAI